MALVECVHCAISRFLPLSSHSHTLLRFSAAAVAVAAAVDVAVEARRVSDRKTI